MSNHDIKMMGIAGLVGLAIFASAMLPAFAASAYTADNQSVTTTYNTAKDITLTGSGLSPMFFELLNGPVNGALTNFNDTTGFVTYTPNAGFSGDDTFTFGTTDGVSDHSDPATVTVIVRPQPVTADVTFTTPYNTAVSVQLQVVNGATFVIVNGPDHGHLENLDALAGTVTYVPDSNFVGTDTVSFYSSDGVNTSTTSTAAITVEPNHRRGGNDEVYYAGVTVGKGLAVELKGAAIPTDPEHQSLAYVSPFAIFVAMAGAGDAGYTWNNLSDAQQAWIVFHLDDLWRLGSQ